MTESDIAPAVRVLYFASLGEQLGVQEEKLNLPGDVRSLHALREHLGQRGPKWRALFSDTVRMAVNQEVARAGTPVSAGDEIAFFPPVTGG